MDGKIETFLDQIGVGGLQREFDMNVRIDLHIGADRRRQVIGAKKRSGADFQQAAGFGLQPGHGEFHFLHVIQYLPASLQVDRSHLGQVEIARGPVQQPYAQAILELHDMLGGHGSR